MEERELDRIAEMVVQRLRGGKNKQLDEEDRDDDVGPEALASSSGLDTNQSETELNKVGAAHFPSLPVDLAPLIDHTLLAPETTQADIENLCAEGLTHNFAAVCVDGSWVELCVQLLDGFDVRVATVAGFPHGAMTARAKATQTAELVGSGADEIDMVAPIGRIIDGDWDYVEDDIAGVVAAADGRVIKVILETAVLSPTRIVQASAIAMEAGASFVKTSTGFHPAGGATEDAVALMFAAVGDKLGVKAAGGIRARETALEMVAAGATRIGTSKGVDLVLG